jgi:hypothetical protein
MKHQFPYIRKTFQLGEELLDLKKGYVPTLFGHIPLRLHKMEAVRSVKF